VPLGLSPQQQLQDEIENTTVQFQRISQAQLNLQATTVAAITQQLQAEQQAQVTVIQATASANATLLDATARADVLNLTVSAEGAGYKAMATALALDTRQLLDLVWVDALLATNASVSVSAATPQTTHAAP
jgi:regulator of protease activity HflC (stomatin/prohibitin superfamily)